MKPVVIYWSQSGNTEAMAKAIAEGAHNCDIFNISDIDVKTALTYDVIALGCPAMGSEELEDGEMQPFVEDLLPHIRGKKIALFGSHDWGSGEWMETWQKSMESSGAAMIADGLICNLEPEEDTIKQCKILGSKLL